MRSSSARRPITAALTAALTLGFAGPALALDPQPEPPMLFQLRLDQSIAVSLVNTAARGTAHIRLDYIDVNGRILRTLTPHIAPGARFQDALSVQGAVGPRVILLPDSTTAAVAGTTALLDAGGRILASATLPALRP